MMELLLAVVVSSVLGSIHCVGMCGPFAALATGGKGATGGSRASVSVDEGRTLSQSTDWERWRNRVTNMTSYHLGRLATYLVIGAMVGSVGAAVNGLAGSWGIGAIAAKGVGVAMIAMGLARFWSLSHTRGHRVAHSEFWQRWSHRLIQVRKKLPSRSPAGSAFSWGLLSTWLPCGWLYVFALAAAGTGGVISSMTMMFAFWIGTLPLLSVVALGAAALGPSRQRWFQPLAAMVLIAFGGYTLLARSQIDLSPLARGASRNGADALNKEPALHAIHSSDGRPMDIDMLKQLTSSTLPCCEADASEDEKDATGEVGSTHEDAPAARCEHCRTADSARTPIAGFSDKE